MRQPGVVRWVRAVLPWGPHEMPAHADFGYISASSSLKLAAFLVVYLCLHVMQKCRVPLEGAGLPQVNVALLTERQWFLAGGLTSVQIIEQGARWTVVALMLRQPVSAN